MKTPKQILSKAKWVGSELSGGPKNIDVEVSDGKENGWSHGWAFEINMMGPDRKTALLGEGSGYVDESAAKKAAKRKLEYLLKMFATILKGA